MVSLDYIADFKNGKGHEKSIVADGKYIVVNSKFISTDGQVRKYSDDQICPLYVDDILMVMSDLPNGRALAKCYLVDEDDKYTLNQRIGAFTVSRPDLVTTKYLYYILSRNPQLLRYDNGADQTNLRKADILNILIAIPMFKSVQIASKLSNTRTKRSCTFKGGSGIIKSLSCFKFKFGCAEPLIFFCIYFFIKSDCNKYITYLGLLPFASLIIARA